MRQTERYREIKTETNSDRKKERKREGRGEVAV